MKSLSDKNLNRLIRSFDYNQRMLKRLLNKPLTDGRRLAAESRSLHDYIERIRKASEKIAAEVSRRRIAYLQVLKHSHFVAAGEPVLRYL